MSTGANVDRGWAWVVLFGGFVTFFVNGGFLYTNGVFFVSMLRHFGHSRAYTSWMIALAASFFQIAGPLACWLITHLGCRGAMVLGAVVMAAGYFVSAFASSFLTVLVSYGVVMAAGQCLTYCSTVVVLNAYFERLHALATSVAMTGNGVGTFVMGHLLEHLTTTRGWRETFIACAGMSLQLCVVGFCFFPLRPRCDLQSADGLRRDNRADKSAAQAQSAGDRTHTSRRTYTPTHQQDFIYNHSQENVNACIRTPEKNEKDISDIECTDSNSLGSTSYRRSDLHGPIIGTHSAGQRQVENGISIGNRAEKAAVEPSFKKKELKIGWPRKQLDGNILARWDSRDLLARACLGRTCGPRPPPPATGGLRSVLLGDEVHVSGNPHSFCTLSMAADTRRRPAGSRREGTTSLGLSHNDALLSPPLKTASCKDFVDIAVSNEDLKGHYKQSDTPDRVEIASKDSGPCIDLHENGTSSSQERKENLSNYTEARDSDDPAVAETPKSIFERRKLFPDCDEESTQVEHEDRDGRWPKDAAAESGLRAFLRRAKRSLGPPCHHPHVWCLGVATMLVQMAAATHYGLCKDMLLAAGVGEAYSTVISVMGVADLLSRLTTGLLCTLQAVDVTVLYMLSMAGVSAALLLHAALLQQHTTATAALAYLAGGAFATCYSATNVLLAVVPARRFGRQQLAQVFGIQLFWCGVGAFCGPVLGGLLVDGVRSYTVVQLFTAGCAAAGAACTLAVSCTGATHSS